LKVPSKKFLTENSRSLSSYLTLTSNNFPTERPPFKFKLLKQISSLTYNPISATMSSWRDGGSENGVQRFYNNANSGGGTMTRYTPSSATAAFNYSSSRVKLQCVATDGGYVSRVMAQIMLDDSRKDKSR